MRYIEKYLIATGISWGDLSDEVEKYLEDGFVPFGSPFKANETEYVQPVMKMNTDLDVLTEELMTNAGQ